MANLPGAGGAGMTRMKALRWAEAALALLGGLVLAAIANDYVLPGSGVVIACGVGWLLGHTTWPWTLSERDLEIVRLMEQEEKEEVQG